MDRALYLAGYFAQGALVAGLLVFWLGGGF